MEPISMAIGIVPLSMQLVKTIITIKELVNDHRSAAKELDHICRKLDKLEDVCKLLNIALSEASGSSFTIGQSVMFDNLQCTIKECCVEVSHIYQDITKISKSFSKTRNPFRSTGYILLNYRRKLASCVESLDNLVGFLTLSLSAFSAAMSVKPVQPPNLSLPPIRPTQNTGRFQPKQESGASDYHVQPARDPSQVLVEKWRRQCSSLGFLQKTQKLRTILGTDTQVSAQVQESSTFTFGSSLLNIYIQFSLMRGPLAPLSIHLQVPRVLMISNRGSDFGISVRKAFESDNIQAIIGFFSQGLLTTATIVTYTEYNPEDEASLLGLAISFKSRKILNFLKDQMDLSEERNHVALLDFPCRWPKTDEGFSCILDYIHMRKMEMTLEEFRRFFHCHEARHMIAYVEACRQYFPDDLESFNDVILREVSYLFGLVSVHQMSSSPIEDWASLLANVAPRDQDLITSSACHFTRTFYFIQQYSFNSDLAWQSLCRWIDILELAQVDVSNYLRVAINMSCKNWADTEAWGSQICDEGIVRRIPRWGHYKGYTVPYWIERADKSCPIRELLTEFPALRDRDSRIRWGGWNERTDVYKLWNSGGNLDASHFAMIYWPVMLPLTRYVPELWDDEDRPRLADWAERACELQERRFERKEQRRRQKLNSKRNGWQNMPGAWVE